ncbi:Tachykinin-like peptides receptor 86C-like 4 [Homarus americanus]|uniref:Tachykinin-like peptides receptor 86C-like 4 n=1 Tax=Homarus americanus TaxID=6706 RepID=A0A8J5MPA9_HOMAM|nr:Tachykinin-like peptides receptor 86C-like 4 [Homarus americanus]
MLALLVGVFALCWLPYHVYFILVHHHPQLSTRPYVQHMYLAFYWLAMSNAMINPIVYYLLNARFRYFFRQLFAEMQGNLRSCVKTSDPSSSDFSADGVWVGGRLSSNTTTPPTPRCRSLLTTTTQYCHSSSISPSSRNTNL